MKTDSHGRPLIACKHCSRDTPMLDTEMCYDCWVFEFRIQGDPVLARRILNEVAPLTFEHDETELEQLCGEFGRGQQLGFGVERQRLKDIMKTYAVRMLRRLS